MNKDNLTTKGSHLIIFGDGGSRGNPGPSASGYVIYTSDMELLSEGGEYLGIATNNHAEYMALKGALTEAHQMGASVVDCFMDSQLVVNQINGIYKVRSEELRPIYQSIKDLVPLFDRVTFTHVMREKNKAADAMVNKILDQHAS